MHFFQKTHDSEFDKTEKITRLKNALDSADAIVIGAGAGLSTSAGFTYSGERFEKHFSDFAKKFAFHDMYSGGFYPYDTLEENWAFWSRNVMINRYLPIPSGVYDDLLSIVREKDYFVLTTNVDHCFQRTGFDKKRIFYTQGDYGLFQCSEPCHKKTYDNEEQIRAMIDSQNLAEDLSVTDETKMTIPTDLIPRCPICAKPMSMNLRTDDTFVQDEGWDEAAGRYEDFLKERKAIDSGKVLFLELGVGSNTPGIIKYPFWQMTHANPNATYACVNFGEAASPEEISAKSICINGDIGEVLRAMKE